MTHPTDDQLLLLAWDESGHPDTGALQSHLAACDTCRARLREIEEARVGMEWGFEARHSARRLRAIRIGLQLAAAVAVVLVVRLVHRPAPAAHAPWQPHLVASPTAGYVAGGATFMTIDSQLTRLEKGKLYGTLQD